MEERREIHKLWEDKTVPIPRRAVEPFYLVPRQLFWILVPFAKGFYIQDCLSMILQEKSI